MKKYHILLIAAMATLGLSACDNQETPAEGEAAAGQSNMMDSVEDASENTMKTIEEAVDETSDSINEMMEDLPENVEEDLPETVDKLMK